MRVTARTSIKMALIPYSFPFSSGLDRSKSPLHSDPGTFYDLLNFRQSRDSFKRLEQTPFFYQLAQLTQGTYYNAGSQTEPSGSFVAMINNDFVMTDYVIETTGSSQIPVFYQTIYPATETVNTGCYVVINDVTSLAITLGNTLDIVIDGATTFKWRKNGGGYTALVPITTAGVSIDGGNATVYFLTTSGFSIADTWSWTRTDCSSSSGTPSAGYYAADWTYYKGTCYFVSRDSRIMMGNTSYAISVGYRPVWGSFISFFDDHMVVGRFSKTYSTVPSALVTGWSDKNDINNFIPTDTNEADQYTLPSNIKDDSVNGAAQIIGVFVQGQVLYIPTNYEMYTSAALGLPIVFSFQKQIDITLSGSGGSNYYFSSCCRADSGVYLLGRQGIFFFDGATTTQISEELFSLFTSNFRDLYMVYDRFNHELIVYYQSTRRIYTYQERWKTWYSRGASFTGIVVCGFVANGVLRLGLQSRIILAEDTTGTHQPVSDSGSGAAYTVPTITTQVLGGSLRSMKEVSSTYVGAYILTALSATFYSTNTNAQVVLYWYVCNSGIITGSASTDAGAVWVTTNADGIFSWPRLSFRGLALEIRLNGLSSNKPPGLVAITSIEPLLKLTDAKSPDR